ncbi:GNAT family N-acetyltransferase [Aestuariivirga litoralis]|uniref:GNAT family N-acetyltransferase n=1 Tax=Aestuariivirga litoralis TaxID=2650924 RepID=UPI0018C7D0C0|nr:GNAT family N-acetyltransferase [Aestuariivirga litoralis]MBG1231183.1 GNAT family N-acetyltransferase [Aestuariivirga litoralis]
MAQKGDGQIILDMTRVLALHHGWPERVTATAEDFERHLFGDNPIINALIAMVDGQPAGAAIWHRSFSTNRGAEIAYLEDLTVLPDFRKRGVGKALMQAVARAVSERGIPAIWWQAEGWNENALKFYEGLGAEGHGNVVVWSLKGDELQKLGGEA